MYFNPDHIELNKYSLPSTGSSLGKDEEIERGHFNEEMALNRCAELYVTVSPIQNYKYDNSQDINLYSISFHCQVLCSQCAVDAI